MTFKPAFWRPVAWGFSALNLVALGFAMADNEPRHAMLHAVLSLAFGFWASRLRRVSPGSDVQGQLEQQAELLQEMQTLLADQSAQVAELQERLDFAERIMAQAKDRPALEPRPERE